jgi:hypothetical protein
MAYLTTEDKKVIREGFQSTTSTSSKNSEGSSTSLIMWTVLGVFLSIILFFLVRELLKRWNSQK